MRFLNKTFFRFTLGFLIIIALSLLLMYAASAYAAGVEKIVFTTDVQSIKPNTLSGPIKIQFQDSDDKPIAFGETQQLLLESSTGNHFFNDSGEDLSLTINSNWTSRTFYYRDSTEGTFTITASVVGTNLSATQQIIISSGAPQNSNQTSSGEVLSANTESSTNTQSSGGSTISRTSSLGTQLEVLAGSDRVTSPGSPIWLQGTIKKNTTGASLDLSWSFGDGNVGVGPLVSHTYKYPGEYVVVLSANAGDIFSVSRLKVKVMDSNISVVDKGEYIEVSNNSNVEINLFNWKIESGGRGFIFQPNTIILPRATLKLDKNLLTMKGLDNSLGISLKNSLKEEIFASLPAVEHFKIAEIMPESEIAKMANQNLNQKEATSSIVQIEEAKAEDLATNVIYEAPKEESFMIKLTNLIKRVFSR